MWLVLLWLGRHGPERLAKALHGVLWQVRIGMEGLTRCAEARKGMAGLVH